MASTDPPAGNTIERSALIHREIVQVGALIVIAAVAFLLTRAVAANNRDMSLRDAAEWYRRGQQQLEAGKVDDAIDSFRRATVRNRGDKRYVLALARGLVLKRDDDAARGALMTLRESAPEDPGINLELARLAAVRQDVTEAVRFYRNALYAPWPAEQADARRGVRVELIQFLLAHDQRDRALPELLAVSADLPDDVPLHLQVARLFAEAGDHRHALDQFQRTLRLAPDNGDALAGAGQTAFRLGEYTLARQYLRRAPASAEEAQRTREVVDLVLSKDPLAARLGTAERRRRLVANFSYARERWDACLAQRPSDPASSDAMSIQGDVQAFEGQLKPTKPLEQDTIETGVTLIDRIEQVVVQRCGPATALDRALVLIGRQHGAETP